MNHEDVPILNNNNGGLNLNLDSDNNNFDPQQTPTMMRMSRFFPSPLIEQRQEFSLSSSTASGNNNNNNNNNNNGNFLGARSHSAGFIPTPSPLNFDIFSPSVGPNIGLIPSNLSSNNNGGSTTTGSNIMTSFSTPIKSRTPNLSMDPYSNIPSNSNILGSNITSNGITSTTASAGANTNGSLSVTPGTLNGITGLPQPFDEFALNAQNGSSSITNNTSVNVNGVVIL
ncbi:unnamed protein product [[Candida] boidinii]|nr:unnamed protein product [[Candida] boidinii]